MITEDPGRRAARLKELLELLSRQAPTEDRELLRAFAPVVYAEMPDRMALGLTVEALASRMSYHFRVFAREMSKLVARACAGDPTPPLTAPAPAGRLAPPS